MNSNEVSSRSTPSLRSRSWLWQCRRSLRYGVIDLWARWASWRRPERPFADFNGVILTCMHHVTRAEEPRFAQFIDWLKQHFELLSYSAAVHQIATGQGSGPRLAISFDDGLENHLSAARIMAERQVSACFFICPGIIGQPVNSETAKFCVERLLIPPTSFLSWEQVEQMKNWGHEIGGHTQDHLNLAQISATEVTEQLTLCRDTLRQRLGQVEHFAWTYGRFADFSQAAFEQVFALGYRSCASGVRGSHAGSSVEATPPARSPQQICLRREQVEMSWPIHHREFFLARSQRFPISREASVPTVWE